jgi:hypothetical protein
MHDVVLADRVVDRCVVERRIKFDNTVARTTEVSQELDRSYVGITDEFRYGRMRRVLGIGHVRSRNLPPG